MVVVHWYLSGTVGGTGTWDRRIKNQSVENCNQLIDKQDTSDLESRMASFVAFLGENRPELAKVVEMWDRLPDAVRFGIGAMVEAARKADETS